MSFLFQEGDEMGAKSVKEFAEVKSNKKEREEWFKNTVLYISQRQEERTYQQRLFLAAYRGFYLEKNEGFFNKLASFLPFGSSYRANRFRKFVVNHIHDITETKISQRAKIKPDVEVLPVHDEFTDKGAAKVTKTIVKNVFEDNDFDDLMTQLDRYAEIMGEAYMFGCFDEERGQPIPAYKNAVEAGLKKLVAADGTNIPLDKEIKSGEVVLDVEIPWRVLVQPKSKFEDVEYLFRIHLMPIKRTAKRFKVKESDLDCEGMGGTNYFSPESLTTQFLENHVPVYEFWHKKTEDVPKGCHAFVAASGKELMVEDLPLSSGDLPVKRLTALDFPEELHGVSRYEFALPIQRMYDNVSTLITKNIYLTGRTKWVIQEGSVDKPEQLGNDNTIVEYNGPVAPQLIAPPTTSSEVYQFRANLLNELQVIMGGVTDQARGMDGVKYASQVAMQYINELELNRASSAISKRARFITQMARLVISIAKDNYNKNDGRLLKLVGKNNSYMLQQFDVAVLHKPYDVRFENSSGIPESRAAKMERAQILVSQYPQALTPERWMQVLELGDPEKANTLKTAAVTAADAVVERILNGDEVKPPEEFDDHLVHWETMAAMFQNISFKEEASNEVYIKAKLYMIAREKLMLRKAQTNASFSAQLARFPLFPLFDHPEFPPPQSQAQQEAVVQGQANKGEVITGQIPAKPKDEE